MASRATRVRAAIARAWRRLIAPAGRWPRLVVVAACLTIVAMYATNYDMNGEPDTVRGAGGYHPVIARGDGHMLYLMARSTALDGDWVFDNDLARFGDPWNAPRTATGRKSIIHPLGPALVWTPLIWIADGGAVIANVFGADIPLHGYTLWTQWIVFLSSALFGCGAVLVGLKLARRLIGGTWAPSYATAAILLGTPLTYYATYMPSYAHAMDAFACAGFLGYWALTLGRRDARRWIALGVLLGIATLIRVQELAMGIVVAIEVVGGVIDAVRARADAPWLPRAVRLFAGGAIALVVALIVFIPQLVEWKLVFGSVRELPQGARYTRLNAPMIAELLWSARNGWLSTTPIAYAAVIGLCCLPRRVRLIAIGLGAAVVIQIYLNSTILDWWGGAAYGQRRLCNVTLPLVVGLAALLWRCGRLVARAPRVPRWVWHAIVVGVFGALVAVNLERVGRLRAGRPASPDLEPCCNDVAWPIRGAVRWIYDRVGNPFEFPANAIFAVRHRVDLAAWDHTVGNYPLVPPLDTLTAEPAAVARLWQTRGDWHIGSPGLEPFLVGGVGGDGDGDVAWSKSLRADRPFRFTRAATATVLVPNLMPYGQQLALWLAPGGAHHAIVRWNGEQVADVELAPGWNAVRFALPTIALHTNELTIEAATAAFTPPANWPAPTVPVGVAVGNLELKFLPP